MELNETSVLLSLRLNHLIKMTLSSTFNQNANINTKRILYFITKNPKYLQQNKSKK